MKRLQMLMMAAASVAAGMCYADASTTAIVSDAARVPLHNAYNRSQFTRTATNTINVVTLRQAAEYPASVTAPAFWFDCSDTTGWGMSENGGVTYVTNVPSRAGSKWAGVRWLTTRPGGGDWVGWGDAQQVKPNAPMLATNATGELGNGGRYLDFQDGDHHRALLFNTDGAGYNALTNIGTVVAIWGSDVRNGGHFLGGGGANYQFGWHRAGDTVTGSGTYWSSVYRWSSYIMNGNAQAAAKLGYLWHDGHISGPMWSGYNGGWEVLSLQCTAATAEACGIGANDKRSGMSWVSGGQQVAELIIFDEVLPRDDIAKIELYLEQKWFGRKRTGWNGKGRVGVVNAYETNFAGEIHVAADETLEVDRLTGGTATGSNKATMTKTGAGALVFAGEGAQDYAAEIVLREGTLSFPAIKAVPTAEQLPARIYARFDASDKASRTTDAEGRVSHLANLVTTDNARSAGKPFSLRQNIAARQPTVRADELGAGLDVLDFGAYKISTGQTMWFSTNETAVAGSNPCRSLWGIQTVVAFIGVQEGGGSLFDNRCYTRYPYVDWGGSRFHYPICSDEIGTQPTLTRAGLTMWTNGHKSDAAKGYEMPGYQVVAFEMPGQHEENRPLNAVMRSPYAYGNDYYYGGGRIGEILMWNRALTEDELKDAQAYMMAKWLKRTMPGYARAAGAFVPTDLQNVVIPAGARVMIDVGAGRTVRIGKATIAGELVKTGAGTIEVEQVDYLYDGQITVQAGEMKGIGVRDVESDSELAQGASLHLDATDAKHLHTNDTGRVKVWGDVNDRVGGWCTATYQIDAANTGHAPILKPAAEGLNGKPIVDFGTRGDSGAFLMLDRPLHSIKSVYAVIRYPGGTNSSGTVNGFLFGSGSGRNEDAGGTRFPQYPWEDADDITFHPGLTDGKWDGRIINGYNGALANNVWTNGVNLGSKWNAFRAVTNTFQLMEFHPSVPTVASQIGLDREVYDRLGGFALAELVVYERTLSEREKVATRNYLMRKWLDPDYAAELPEAPAKPEIRSHVIEVAGEATFANDADVEKVRVTGEGTLTKTGEGTLTVRDLSAFDGTVNVNAGTLEVLYGDPYATPNLPTEGILYHADATKGLTTTTNAANVICIKEWANQGSAPLKSVATGGGGQETAHKVIFDADVGYKPTVDMTEWNTCFEWRKADGSSTAIQTLSGIKSIFWMIGSQNGGGFMMGGGTNATGTLSHMWHRGIYYPIPGQTSPNFVGTTNLCTVLNGNMQASVKNAKWWKNGNTMGWNDYLSGKWDQLSMIVADDAQNATASGFAYDGRSRKASGATNHEYNGHQRLAEVICYDRRVTDEERQQIECYLRCKWLNNMHAAAANVVVNVASGATLKVGGNSAFAGITGTGTVEGDVTLGVFQAIAGGTGFTVDGTLTVTANPTVDVTNIESWKVGADIVIATATTVAGVENLKNATITGLPAGKKARLKQKDGVLKIAFAKGALIYVR